MGKTVFCRRIFLNLQKESHDLAVEYLRSVSLIRCKRAQILEAVE